MLTYMISVVANYIITYMIGTVANYMTSLQRKRTSMRTKKKGLSKDIEKYDGILGPF